MEKEYYVYIMSNRYNTTLYIGVTSDLEGRVWEHRHKVIKGFTAKYNVYKLVYYEQYNHIDNAIAREKQLKGWSRIKKVKLIQTMNKGWIDLIEEWKGQEASSFGAE